MVKALNLFERVEVLEECRTTMSWVGCLEPGVVLATRTPCIDVMYFPEAASAGSTVWRSSCACLSSTLMRSTVFLIEDASWAMACGQKCGGQCTL